jgi:hypothetical protein
MNPKILAAALRAAADVLDQSPTPSDEQVQPSEPKRPRGRPRKVQPTDGTPPEPEAEESVHPDPSYNELEAPELEVEDPEACPPAEPISDDEMKAILTEASERIGRKKVMEICHEMVRTVRVAEMAPDQRVRLREALV